MAKRRVDWDRIRWGSLTRWCREHNREIRRVFGSGCFNKDGSLNDRVLRQMYAHPDKLARITRRWRLIWEKIGFKLNVLRRR